MAIFPEAIKSSSPHFPTRLLYATSARIGGSGLDQVAYESLKASAGGGFLGRAITFENRQGDIPPRLVRSLSRHPVRLLSFLESPRYYGAKKHYLDWIASRELARGDYDVFQGWSGECVRTLREANRRGVPTLLEVGTWHRHKGKTKPLRKTMSEREREEAPWPHSWLNRLLISRQQVLEEYSLADLILVLSQKAEETFLAAGMAKEKLFRHQRGVDVSRFTPAESPPDIFRVVFVGALIKRKGVHHLLEVWRRLSLKNAELVLVGSVHDEMRPYLEQFGGEDVKLPGFVGRVEDCYRAATVHVFPSECEGSAKCTYEASACGLPQITTRESGDVVIDGVTGLLVPPNDPDALAAAIERLYHDRDLGMRLGAAGRRHIVENLTWDHFRERLLAAYQAVREIRIRAVA